MDGGAEGSFVREKLKGDDVGAGVRFGGCLAAEESERSLRVVFRKDWKRFFGGASASASVGGPEKVLEPRESFLCLRACSIVHWCAI